MANLIQAAELDVAAVFPQCMDNQCVTFDDFRNIVQNNLSYKDKRISENRNARTEMEINRALVYGQQVCVNRASLPNCKPLYELYLPTFTVDGKQNPRYQIDEVGELLRTQAIVPYLFQGTTIEGDGKFNLDNEGQRALAHLLDKHGSIISFLTLGATPEKVRVNAAKIALEFETRAHKLAGVAENPDLYRLLLGDVLPCVQLVETTDAVEFLQKLLFTVSEMVNGAQTKRRRNLGQSIGMLSREDIYRECLVKKCSCGKGFDSKECRCVTDGCFSAEVGDAGIGAAFCLKTLVDLVYASNIPDMLHKYLMTPYQLPTRNALQDNGLIQLQQSATIDNVAEATFEASQRFHASATEAMYLPMLSQLTLADICETRRLSAWKAFMEAQEGLLQSPLENAGQFDEFQAKFAALQLAISKYWSKKKFDGNRGKKYRNFVSGVFQIGIHALKIGIRTKLHGPEVYMLDRVIDYVANCSERVNVGPAKLLFEVFDAETGEVDAARSWSVEWMRNQVSWSKQDLLTLLKNERQLDADDNIAPTKPPADISGG